MGGLRNVGNSSLLNDYGFCWRWGSKKESGGLLGGARLLGQQIKDEASGMSDWVLITHNQSLQ